MTIPQDIILLTWMICLCDRNVPVLFLFHEKGLEHDWDKDLLLTIYNVYNDNVACYVWKLNCHPCPIVVGNVTVYCVYTLDNTNIAICEY